MEIEIRSSSWGDLLDCAARWEAIHVLHMQHPASVPAHIGTSIHHGTAKYDQAKVEGREPDLKNAIGAAVDKFEHPQEDVRWTAEDYSQRDALSVVIQATTAYCKELSPSYIFKAVELRPAPLEVNVEGAILRISGQMDRTRVNSGEDGIGIIDVKTGKSVVSASGKVNTSGHKFQLGIYELLAEHSLDWRVTEPAAIAGISTNKFKIRTGIGIVNDAKGLMLGTEENPGIIETVGKMVKHGLFPPNPRSRLCSEKWCPRYHSCSAHD